MKPRRVLVALSALAFPAILAALTFSEWQAVHFTPEELVDPAISGATADPDGDGLINLHEYAFAGDPWGGESIPLPKLELIADTFTLTYQERRDLTDVDIRLQRSNNLLNWITYNAVAEADREEFADHDQVTLLDPVAFDDGRRFLRLRLELLPTPALRSPIQVSLTTPTLTTWILAWTDPNTEETGYAIERKSLLNGEWERLATVGPDTGAWTHTGAHYQSGTSYRVVALGADNLEAASGEIVPPDTDNDGLIDCWEIAYFGNLAEVSEGNYDSDGFTNRQEHDGGSNPAVDYYQGTRPVIEAVSGRDQNYTPGEFLPKPLVVRVRDAAGNILAGAPIIFTARAEEGVLSKTKNYGAEFAASQLVHTDTQGLAQVWLKCP